VAGGEQDQKGKAKVENGKWEEGGGSKFKVENFKGREEGKRLNVENAEERRERGEEGH
jgi:hypothetical protein